MKEVSEQEKALVFFENIEAPVLQKGSLKKLMSIMKISKDTIVISEFPKAFDAFLFSYIEYL
jgi:hypothetical protein